MFETFNYKENTFTVWEEEDGFLVVVDDEVFKLNSVTDVTEFIQYYNLLKGSNEKY